MVCDPRRIAAVAWQGARCLQQSASIDDVHVVENRHAGDLRRGVPEFRNRRNAILRCHLAHFNCVLTEGCDGRLGTAPNCCQARPNLSNGYRTNVPPM